MSLRILIVDDDLGTLRILAMLLTRVGFIAETCESGARALELLRASPHDVLLTDYLMPGMNGAELVAIARASWPQLRCMIMSGLRANHAAGDVEWLDKPLDVEALAATLGAAGEHD